ncbi:MAG: peptidylprolyl isomerase, partial [Pseudomonas sp.]
MPNRFFATVVLLLLSTLVGAESISYTRDVQPILTEKCVACHACYDAPCQLNLGSAEGVSRGASKTPVYDGARTAAVDTSR